jgi:hypothetical protein
MADGVRIRTCDGEASGSPPVARLDRPALDELLDRGHRDPDGASELDEADAAFGDEAADETFAGPEVLSRLDNVEEGTAAPVGDI